MGAFRKGTGDRTKAQLAAPPLVGRKGPKTQKVSNTKARQVTAKGK